MAVADETQNAIDMVKQYYDRLQVYYADITAVELLAGEQDTKDVIAWIEENVITLADVTYCGGSLDGSNCELDGIATPV